MNHIKRTLLNYQLQSGESAFFSSEICSGVDESADRAEKKE